MDKKHKELHYYEYCTGHGFEEEYDDSWESCSQCGDTAKTYIFSFSSKEEFMRKYTYQNTLRYYQDDEGTRKEPELIDIIGRDYYAEEVFVAGQIYDELWRDV